MEITIGNKYKGESEKEIEITKEYLLENGGKLWEKEHVCRIYINDECMINAFKFTKMKDPKWAKEFKGIGKAKVWFDCADDTLHSDVGMIRVLFNSNYIECTK